MNCHNCPRQTMYCVDLLIHDPQVFHEMKDELAIEKRKVLSGSRARRPPSTKPTRREQVAEMTSKALNGEAELFPNIRIHDKLPEFCVNFLF